MGFGPVIDELIDALRVLPGVGQKSAQRMALHLLERNRAGAKRLAFGLENAVEKIGYCSACQNFSEHSLCAMCQDNSRDKETICIVESPLDLMAIEQSHHYKGQYFVLKGSLSPLDGRGPNEIGIPSLVSRVQEVGIKEVILATNPTIEGEATSYYIAETLSAKNCLITRLAHGLSMGSELGYVDGGTLNHAFSGRKPVITNE
jgi:recombination protein RecR